MDKPQHDEAALARKQDRGPLRRAYSSALPVFADNEANEASGYYCDIWDWDDSQPDAEPSYVTKTATYPTMGEAYEEAKRLCVRDRAPDEGVVELHRCTCAEIEGEDPDCPLHELTLARIAAWEDWECATRDLDGYTARKVAQKALSPAPPAGEEVVERDALVTRGYALERRALSFATATPAVNMLLAELGEYARAAAEILAALPSTPRGVPEPEVEGPAFFERVAETVKEAGFGNDGFWNTCSGCHESEDGYDVGHYPFSPSFNCKLGGGCSECGGIGAVWDTTDYDAMARDMLAADDESPAPSSIRDQALEEAAVEAEEWGSVGHKMAAAIRALKSTTQAVIPDELRRLSEKATQGEWTAFDSNGIRAIMKGQRPERGTRWDEIVTWGGFDGCHVPKKEIGPNVRLIVHAVNFIRQALAKEGGR